MNIEVVAKIKIVVETDEATYAKEFDDIDDAIDFLETFLDEEE